jgi:hypothetical protein
MKQTGMKLIENLDPPENDADRGELVSVNSTKKEYSPARRAVRKRRVLAYQERCLQSASETLPSRPEMSEQVW